MDIIKKAIQVQKIEDSAEKITLFEQTGEQKYPTKYTFFKKTQKGEMTKAYDQFNELDVQAGKVYQIAVKETKGMNKVSGKEITYRNIAFFYTGDTSNITEQTSPQSNSDELSKRLDNASKAFVELDRKLNEKIKALDLRLSVLELETKEKQNGTI